MENIVIHKANNRGHSKYEWLDARHSFSFAQYYNPERMRFGVLRVLNDDIIDEGMGFGSHMHEDMEIITIPLEGELEHKDNMGNTAVIGPGEVQVMSAGTGIYHSEYNKNEDSKVKLLQIWLLPNKKGVKPRYDNVKLDINDRHNKLQQILSPFSSDEGVWIYQNAWFHLGRFDKGVKTQYEIKSNRNGVYTFVISGDIIINDQKLNVRDGMGIRNAQTLTIEPISSESELLIMEVPMQNTTHTR